MTTPEPIQIVRLAEVGQRLKRRWRTVAVTTLVTIMMAVGFAYAIPKEYTATAALTVSPITTNPFSSAAVNQSINITTERAILASSEVAAKAAKELGETVDPGTLLLSAEVAAPSGSQVLRVSVTGPDPGAAAAAANAMARAYLEFRGEGAAEVAQRYIKAIDEQIEQLSSAGKLADEERQKITALETDRTSFSVVSQSPGRVIGWATVPNSPTSLGLATLLIAGIMGGLLLGAGVALARERFDPLVRLPVRFGAYFQRSPIVLESWGDSESARWIVHSLREVQASRPADARSGGQHVSEPDEPAKSLTPLMVGILRVDGDDVSGASHALARAFEGSTATVQIVPAPDVMPAAIDMGWPRGLSDARRPEQGVVLIEVSAEVFGSRLAALSDKLHALVLVSGRRSRLDGLRKLLGDVAAMPLSSLVPVFELHKVVPHPAMGAGPGHAREMPELRGQVRDAPVRKLADQGRTPEHGDWPVAVQSGGEEMHTERP